MHNKENIAELWKKWSFLEKVLISNLIGIILTLAILVYRSFNGG